MKESRRSYIIILLLFILMALWIVNRTVYDRNVLEKNHRYTIGTTATFIFGDSSPAINVKYTVNGREYEALSIPEDINIVKEWSRYYMKYNPDDIGGDIDVLYENPVPDSIIQAPDTGWAEILHDIGGSIETLLNKLVADSIEFAPDSGWTEVPK